MTCRTFEQMVDAAVEQRRQLINDDQDPERAEFRCTHEERSVLKMQRLPDRWLALSADYARICGLLIVSN